MLRYGGMKENITMTGAVCILVSVLFGFVLGSL